MAQSPSPTKLARPFVATRSFVRSAPAQEAWQPASNTVFGSLPSAAAAFMASNAGTIASSIVASSTVEWPLCFTPSTADSRPLRNPSMDSSWVLPTVMPIRINAVPYSGPEAPPTVETRVMPTFLKIVPISASAIPGSRPLTA